MSGSMRGPRGKIKRAKKHITEYEAALGDLTFSNSTHPQVIVTDDDLEPGKKAYKIASIPCVLDDTEAIAGDAIHNLRVSLDLLFGQLILANGKKELGPNRYRTRFVLGRDCGAYVGLARLLVRQ
jgi:hypothetical protein